MNRNDIERLSNMEVKFDNINNKLDEHCKNQREDFDKIFAKLDAHQESFEKKIEAIGNKKAGKWVEKVAVGIAITVLSGIVMLVLTAFK